MNPRIGCPVSPGGASPPRQHLFYNIEEQALRRVRVTTLLDHSEQDGSNIGCRDLAMGKTPKSMLPTSLSGSFNISCSQWALDGVDPMTRRAFATALSGGTLEGGAGQNTPPWAPLLYRSHLRSNQRANREEGPSTGCPGYWGKEGISLRLHWSRARPAAAKPFHGGLARRLAAGASSVSPSTVKSRSSGIQCRRKRAGRFPDGPHSRTHGHTMHNAAEERIPGKRHWELGGPKGPSPRRTSC